MAVLIAFVAGGLVTGLIVGISRSVASRGEPGAHASLTKRESKDYNAPWWARALADLLAESKLPSSGILQRIVENAPEDALPHLHGGLGDLTKALLERDRPDIVVMLDEALLETSSSEPRRRDIHRELADRGLDASVQPHAERLAARHPMSIPLAAYRPGGVEYLLRIAESQDADWLDRESALIALFSVERVDVWDRLRALAFDQTQSPFSDNRFPGDPPDTIGRMVRRALESRPGRTHD